MTRRLTKCIFWESIETINSNSMCLHNHHIQNTSHENRIQSVPFDEVDATIYYIFSDKEKKWMCIKDEDKMSWRHEKKGQKTIGTQIS